MSINISGEVGKEVRASEVLTQIQAEKGDSIEVTIMSPGGSVVEGLAIYDALRAAGKEIKTLAMGQAASIASIIFMAGDVREVADNAEIMIHNAMVCAGGNKHELSGIIDTLENIDQKLIDIYTDRSGMTAEDVTELLDKETFMSADEAVNKGFATGKANALALVAIHNKQKEPINMADEKKDEDKSVLSKLGAFINKLVRAEGDIPEKEDDAAEEANAEGDDEEKPDLEAENKALKAEVSELKAKAESDDEEHKEMEAKAKEDEDAKAQEDEEEKEEEEDKAMAIFEATVSNKITAGEAKKLIKKSASFVAETLKDKRVNATGLAPSKTPKREVSSHKETWTAMKLTNVKEAQVYYQKHSDAIAKEK